MIKNFNITFPHSFYVNRTLNNTTPSNSTGSVFPEPDARNILSWTTVTLAVCLVGCFNNILVLYVTWPRSGDKSGVNLLIFHFIFANLLNCLIHYPIRCVMVQAKQMGYTASGSVCPVIQTFNTVNWLVVFWADTGLALNRFVALFLPHQYRAYSTTRNNVAQILVIWLGALAMTLPYNLGAGVIVLIPIGHCAIRRPLPLYSMIFTASKNTSLVMGGLASLLILVKCYMMARVTRAIGAQRQDRAVRHRIRMALALVVMYIWTVVSSSASSILMFIYPKVFDNTPLAVLWLQTAAIAQYAFAACIILLSNKKYIQRLRASVVVSRIGPLENTVSPGQSQRPTEHVHMNGDLNSVSRSRHPDSHVVNTDR